MAAYRLFSNEKSARQLKVGDVIFYKVGAKIFDDLKGDNTSTLIGNGISTYLQMQILESANTLAVSVLTLFAASASQLLF